MKKQKLVKTVLEFPDECTKCDYQKEYGEGVCSVCKLTKSVNAKKATITTTLNEE